MHQGEHRPSCSKYPLVLEHKATDGEALTAYRVAASETVQQLAAVPGRPAQMAAFDELLGGGGWEEAVQRSGKPVVAVLCNFVPEELILAAGAWPLRADLGVAAACAIGGRVLAAEVCPVLKGLVGAHLGGLPQLAHADLLVVPTACDGKRKLAGVLAGERAVWVLELPQRRDGMRARQHWYAEIEALARELERLGTRIRRRALRQAIESLNRRSALVRRLNALRWRDPRCLNGRDTFLVLQASFVADPRWWAERTEALLVELEQRGAPEGPLPVRLLLAGSPVLFPDYQLLHLVEERGAVIVADELCSATQRLYHPTVIDEDTVGGMLRAAAEKTLLPCTCPCLLDADLRIDRLLELSRSSGAQGVLHHTLRLCQLFDLELPRVAAALRTQGLPVLDLHTDHASDASAVLRNRIDAFLEMLQP